MCLLTHKNVFICFLFHLSLIIIFGSQWLVVISHNKCHTFTSLTLLTQHTHWLSNICFYLFGFILILQKNKIKSKNLLLSHIIWATDCHHMRLSNLLCYDFFVLFYLLIRLCCILCYCIWNFVCARHPRQLELLFLETLCFYVSAMHGAHD